MNKKTAKRALWSSILSLLLCVSMLVGTTFAWFTDSVTSANNIIASGNLDIELYYQVEGQSDWSKVTADTNVFMDGALWEPGHTEVVKLKVVNEGSLALKYQLGVNVAGETGSTNVNGQDFLLSDYIKFGIVDGAQAYTREQAIAAVDANATALQTAYNSRVIELLPKANDTTEVDVYTDIVTMVVYMPTSVGNEANHATGAAQPTINLGLNLFATQFTYEEDSFGNQYDTESMYPANGSVNKEENKARTIRAGNVEIEIPANAPAGNYDLEVSAPNKTTDAAGNTTISMDITLLKDGVKVEKTDGINYPVKIGVDERLIVIGVDHKGEAVANYNYNPDTGLITFATDSFSPFAVTYFEKVTEIRSAEELIAALGAIKESAEKQIPGENGNKKYRESAIFVLKNDIVIDDSSNFMYKNSNGAPLHFYGMKGILDLNGHSITVTENALLSDKRYANAALLFQYSDVDIVDSIGNGKIIVKNQAKAVFAWANCTVDIYGGTYISNSYMRNCSTVYVNNASATINVYGGTYTETKYAFNAHDTSAKAPVIVLHEGITYKDFLKNDTTDVIASDIRGGRIVMADGCELQEYEENGAAMNKVVAN